MFTGSLISSLYPCVVWIEVTGHYIELGEAEIKTVVLIDQREFDVVAKCFGKKRTKFKTAKAGAEHNYTEFHS